MDTVTHILTGTVIGLVSVKTTNSLEAASLSVAIFSSVISDLDVFTRFLGEKNYLKIHRGITHQFPIIFLLALIAPLIFLGWTYNNFFFYYILSLIAVLAHVLLDILNPYGTKVLPHFKRVKLNVVGTIDPIILGILSFNIIMLGNDIILGLWLLPMYIIIRIGLFIVIKSKLEKMKSVQKCHLLAGYNPFVWNVMLEYPDKFVIANYFTRLYNEEEIIKEYVSLEYLEKIFLTNEYKVFSELAYLYNVKQESDGKVTKIILYDLKYRKNNKYYFRLIFNFEGNQIKSSYIGFTFKEQIKYIDAKKIVKKKPHK